MNYNPAKRLLMSILFTTVSAVSLNAFAEAESGGSSTGGGKSVNGRFLDVVRDPSEVILNTKADGSRQQMIDLLNASPGFKEATHLGIRKNTKTQSVQKKIIQTLDSLTFILVPGPLRATNDAGKVVLPWMFKGKIKQLAVQYKESGKVFVDQKIYSDPRFKADKGAFLLHEALIKVFWNDSRNAALGTTENISNLVNATFHQQLDAETVSDFLCQIGIDATALNIQNLTSVSFNMGGVKGPAYIFLRNNTNCYTMDAEVNVQSDKLTNVEIYWNQEQRSKNGFEGYSDIRIYDRRDDGIGYVEFKNKKSANEAHFGVFVKE